MAWSWRSHSPPWSQIGQSRGWFASKNSITASRDRRDFSELVRICIPLITGKAQDATAKFQLMSGSQQNLSLKFTKKKNFVNKWKYRTFWHFFNFDETHSTISGNRESFMIAKSWNLDSSSFACAQNGGSRFDTHGLSVYVDLYGSTGSCIRSKNKIIRLKNEFFSLEDLRTACFWPGPCLGAELWRLLLWRAPREARESILSQQKLNLKIFLLKSL